MILCFFNTLRDDVGASPCPKAICLGWEQASTLPGLVRGGGGQAEQGERVSPLGAAPSALAPTPFNGAVLYTSQWTDSKGELNLFQAISPFVLLNS